MLDALNINEVGTAIVAAAALGVPAYLMGIPPLIAYLLAGVLIGPHLGLSLIKDSESISALATLGMVLLMFVLGMEIDVRKLLKGGRAVVINGVLQFVLCSLFGLLFYNGFFGASSLDVVYLALATSLSSTVVVVKILSDRMELSSMSSRITLGVLIFQDLWAILCVASLHNIGNIEFLFFVKTIAKLSLLVSVCYAAAKYVVPMVIAKIIRHFELLIIFSIAWCFGVACLSRYLQLSYEMGSLIAGMALAVSPYSGEISSKIAPVRDVFLAMLFISLGMQVGVPNDYVMGLTGAIVAFIFCSRFLVVIPIMKKLGFAGSISFNVALNLSQVSELAIVIMVMGVQDGHVRAETLSATILAMVITFLSSSFLIPRSYDIYRKISPYVLKLFPYSSHGISELKVPESKTYKIVFLGLQETGTALIDQVVKEQGEDVKADILVVTISPDMYQSLSKSGINVLCGDVGNPSLLKRLPIGNNSIVISSVPDHFLNGTTNIRILKWVKHNHPDVKFIATAETSIYSKTLYDQGAAFVLVPPKITAEYFSKTFCDYLLTPKVSLAEVRSIDELKKDAA